MKKAIKKLKAIAEQLKVEVVVLTTAIKEDREQITDLKDGIQYLYDERDAIHGETLPEISQHFKSQIEELDKRVSNINIQRENDIIREMLKEQINKLQFLVNTKNGSIDVLSNKLGNLKSDVQTIAKHVRNLEAEKCSCHTNTQKTDKNATESKQEGKKEYSEVIVTNEMFNDELERFLREETTFYPIQKYTSTDNSLPYIRSLIYDLYIVTEIPNIPELIRSKLKDKGEHYNKESDRYANIKDALKRNKEEEPHLFANWTVVDKINSYKDKHIQWLIDTRGTEQTKTDLQEAYIDVICYCIMCYIYLKFNPEVKNG